MSAPPNTQLPSPLMPGLSPPRLLRQSSLPRNFLHPVSTYARPLIPNVPLVWPGIPLFYRSSSMKRSQQSPSHSSLFSLFTAAFTTLPTSLHHPLPSFPPPWFARGNKQRRLDCISFKQPPLRMEFVGLCEKSQQTPPTKGVRPPFATQLYSPLLPFPASCSPPTPAPPGAVPLPSPYMRPAYSPLHPNPIHYSLLFPSPNLLV